MIVNPDKFKAIVLTKSGQNTSRIQISPKDHCITSENTVTLLGIKIDSRLSFEKHVTKLCKTATTKLNALKRLRPYIISEKTRKILIQSFVSCRFNYCPLVWYFITAKELQKLEKVQETALRFITDDYISTYKNLLINTGMTSMQMGQMQKLCTEIYKTLSNINPRHMQELFERSSSSYSTRRPNDLKVPRVNQTTYGSKSIRFEGARLWNHLPEHIKSAENLNIFKNLIKYWIGPSCGCNYCQFRNQ